MNTLALSRVTELSRRCSKCAQLASGCLPEAVNREILAIAEELEREIERVQSECAPDACPLGANCQCRSFASQLAA